MSGIAIYVEGGGDTADGRAAIRSGFGELLRVIRDAARRHGKRWKIVAAGSRQSAFEAFRVAREIDSDYLPILLVDSEGPVTADEPADHLREHDKQTFPKGSAVFVMAQVMETWLVADPEALANFYGQHFNKNALPKNTQLEAVSKAEVVSSLRTAVARTQKETYDKIGHAEKLLKLVCLDKVRRRCPHCDRFASALERLIEPSP